jgi:HEAT repeat protein
MKYEAALKLREACVTAGLTLFSFVAAAGQNEPALFVDVNGGSATVIANDVPVRDVLEEIAMQSGIIVYSRSALDTNATYSIKEEPVPDLIRRILKQHNFTLHYVSDTTTGVPVFGSRLWIFADDATSTTPLWSVGRPVRDWTLRYAAGDPEKNRLRAISSSATQEDKTSVAPELIAAMNDPSVAVREEAVYGLSESDDVAAVEYLKNSLYDPDKRVRVAAITALADSGNDEATVALSDLLQDNDASIRSEVIHALADIGGNVADHYLQQALADANEINRETAAGYLAEAAGTIPLN